MQTPLGWAGQVAMLITPCHREGALQSAPGCFEKWSDPGQLQRATTPPRRSKQCFGGRLITARSSFHGRFSVQPRALQRATRPFLEGAGGAAFRAVKGCGGWEEYLLESALHGEIPTGVSSLGSCVRLGRQTLSPELSVKRCNVTSQPHSLAL